MGKDRVHLSEDGEILPPDPEQEAEEEEAGSSSSAEAADFTEMLNDRTPKGLFNVARAVLMSPNEFFANLPLEGGDWVHPIIFLTAVSIISALGQALVTLRPTVILEGFFIHMVWGFVSSGVIFLLSRGVGGTGTYQNTFRAFAYASAVSCIFWIPLVNLLAGIYSFYLMKLAIERVHEVPSNRAMTVLGIYLVAIFVVGGTMTAMKLEAMKEARQKQLDKLGI